MDQQTGDDRQQLASHIDQRYKHGLAYKKRMGFLSRWPEYERFKAGDQWPQATERTKNLPRPVFNIIDMIEEHKVASVINEQIKMVFSTLEESEQYDQAADRFTGFSESTWENLEQDRLNEEALDDCSNTGTCCWHYYWDDAKEGGNDLKYKGEMCGEVLDPMNVFFGNPQQRDVQKQPDIIVSSRDVVSNIKALAKAEGVSQADIDRITPDKDTLDQGYDMAQVELDGTDKATVLTQYSREPDGYVYFAKVCSGVVIKPKINTYRKRYPIAIMNWKRRKKSIYGVGDTEGLIPNQKAINFLMAMMLLSVQLTGWPKLIYKKEAIDRNKVTNTPGEMIEDKSPPGVDGVKYLTPGTISPVAQTLVEKFIEHTREMTGAHDAATGQAPSAQLNATAIMLLQKASGVPIESIKRRFYRAMRDIGRIWEEFWKVNYNMTRNISIKDEDRNDVVIPFKGSDYADIEMNLKIDVGASSTYSESLMMSSLDKFLDRQLITFEQYLKYVPKNVVPFKDMLLKEIEQAKAMQPTGGPDINKVLASLPPQLRQQLLSESPDVQKRIIQEAMAAQQGAPQAPPQPPRPNQIAG